MADDYTVVLNIEYWRTLIQLAFAGVDVLKQDEEEDRDEDEIDHSYEVIKAATRQLGWGPY